jgi:hypothetical protein
MQTTQRFIHIVGLAVAGLVAASGLAHAQLTNADVGLDETNTQTGDTAVTSTGGFFSARAFFTNTGDYTGGTLTLPGALGTKSLGDQGVPLEIGFGDSNTDLATLQGLYPAGNYGFDVTGAEPEATFTIPYGMPAAYANTPELTNFSALQGAIAASGVTVDFNDFGINPAADDSLYFFEVTLGGTLVFSASGDPTSSVVIPAGLLHPGETYDFDLDYSSRIVTAADVPGNEDLPLTQFYDIHTSGSFSTAGAVPEPSTWAMLLMGFIGLGVMIRRRAALGTRAA